VESERFDQWTRMITRHASRRRFSRLLAGGALGLAVSRVPITVDARNKKKKSKLKRNAYGCVNVGQPCRGNDAHCCSGICEGNKPKHGKRDSSSCAAHNVGSCQAGKDSCDVGNSCGVGASCYQTTGNASFCGSLAGIACQSCTEDADCVALGHGAAAACIVCALCAVSGNTACVPAALQVL
jgi:hypothetical protein